MKSILIDAGPLIALFDSSDQYHKQAVAFIEAFQGELWSTWPVITEAAHMLDFSTRVQIGFFEWIKRGGLKIFTLQHSHLFRLIELTRKFDDVPMDLADATLIIVSEETKIQEIASLDSDFYIYRNIRNQYLTNVFNP